MADSYFNKMNGCAVPAGGNRRSVSSCTTGMSDILRLTAACFVARF
ncbi:hypothetical protein KDH83_10210 [Achromobacter sp. Marseille-Q0513]|nr:hypothetical protein [Achromobacter sp. Marseille-Q0513]MBR8653676.1 hypothetical protein [Achromobacter sp. Marseille-Q0513]